MLPSALSVDFKVLDDPQSPGDVSSRVIFLKESSPSTSSVISIEVSGGESIAPIPFHLLPLTYDEFEARYPDLKLNDLFPNRPLDPAGGKSYHNRDNYPCTCSLSKTAVLA